MDKLPKHSINGQSPIVTPANETTFKQFEAATSKARERPEQKEHENGTSATNNGPNPMGGPPMLPPHVPPGRVLQLYVLELTIL